MARFEAVTLLLLFGGFLSSWVVLRTGLGWSVCVVLLCFTFFVSSELYEYVLLYMQGTYYDLALEL